MTFKLLIIDDSLDHLSALNDILYDAGYDVRLANSGKRGLEILAECVPDLILLDAYMPTMNGFEVCRVIKEQDSSKSIPVILLNTDEDSNDRAYGFDLGAVDFISQPFHPSDVLARIMVHLQRSQQLADLSQTAEVLSTKVEQEKDRRSQAESVADQKERLLRNVLDTLEMGVWTINEDGLLVLDAVSRNLLGCAEACPENWSSLLSQLRPVSGEVVPEEISDRVVEIRVHPLSVAAGQDEVLLLKGKRGKDGICYGTVRDITNQYFQEKRRQESLRFEELGLISSSIAHDFNNHLAVISGALELIELRGLSSDNIEQALAPIRQAVEQSTSLTQQLLATARGEQVHQMSVNLGRVIKRTSRLANEMGPGITVHVHHDKHGPWVKGDKASLGNLIWNLCINARDAMPKGGELTLATGILKDSPGDCVLTRKPIAAGQAYVEVADTGEGIADDVQAHIFSPLVSTKIEHGGSGLGLASVSRSVTQMGGQIYLKSVVGKGTRFLICFPPIAMPQSTIGTEPPTAVFQRSDRKRILIVDDQQQLTHMLGDGLTKLGWEVAVLNDGRQTRHAYQSAGGYDIVLVDMVMPGLTGVDVFDVLRTIDASVKVVLMTGLVDPQSERRLLAQGLMAIVHKPIRLRQLDEELRNLLLEDEEMIREH